MKGGYYMVDCENLDLTSAVKVTKSGFWAKAKKCLAANKPIVAYNCIYWNGKPVSPVTCFGWYIDTKTIVIVGATLHIIIDDADGVVVQDVGN